MSNILIDRIASLTLHNGIVRIECHAMAPDGKEQPSGNVLIPVNQAASVIQSLVSTLQELDKKMREGAQSQGGVAGNA